MERLAQEEECTGKGLESWKVSQKSQGPPVVEMEAIAYFTNPGGKLD